MPGTLKERAWGFTLIEICVAIAISLILIAVALMGYKTYQSRYQCRAAAQVLTNDLKLQQMKSRSYDEQRGILFTDNSTYYLGQHSPSGPFSLAGLAQNTPTRSVNLHNEFGGVTIESINGNISFPNYICFDPRAADTSGDWVLFSGFSGIIVLRGNNVKARVIVQSSGEITIEME